MCVLRPLLSQGLDLEPALLDDLLVLGRGDRADRVRDGAAGPYALGRDAQQVELELGQRLGPPAEVGP